MAHEHIIRDCFPREQRPLVEAILKNCLSGLSEDRQAAVLFELALPTELTGEAALEFMGGFIRSIGGGAVDANRFTSWVDAGGPGFTDPFPPDARADAEPLADPADDDAGEAGKLTYVSGALRTELLEELRQSQAPSGPDRTASAKADVARFESMMRDDPRAYWNSPSNQTAYRDALTVLHGGSEETTS